MSRPPTSAAYLTFSAQEEEAECEQDYADGDGDDSGWVSRQR